MALEAHCEPYVLEDVPKSLATSLIDYMPQEHKHCVCEMHFFICRV